VGEEMFIVNQNKNKIVEFKEAKLYSCYPQEIEKELNAIYQRMYDKVYNYGSTERCLMEIIRYQNDYLYSINSSNGEKQIHIIKINDENFAEYKEKDNAKKMLDDLINAISNNETIYQLT
jgi:hypothetical protein